MVDKLGSWEIFTFAIFLLFCGYVIAGFGL
jgi:hypothetical protein